MDDDNEGEVNGFFKTYHVDVLKKVDDGDLHKLSLCKTNQERLAFAYALPYVHGIRLEPAFKGKDQAVAKQHRLDGNEAFKTKSYPLALSLYSRSILHADPQVVEGEPELALGLANRSAVLFHLKNYPAALTDITLALENQYPSALRCKLLERRARCLLLHHGSRQEIDQACLEAISSAKESQSMDPRKMQQFNKDIQGILEEAKRKSCSTQNLVKVPQLPEVTGGRNDQFPNASASLRVEASRESGRYAVAAKDVAVGDVIVVEKPWASVMQAMKYETHCHHCYKPLDILYPCPNCSGIAFCSVQCRDVAVSTYHRIECPLIDLLREAGISITCNLALRMITQYPLEFFQQVKPYLEGKEQPKDETMRRYIATYHLVTHEDHRSPASFVHITLMGIFLLKCLKIGGYFPSTLVSERELDPEELYIGGLLLRHIQLLQFNAHEVAELEMFKPDSMEGAKSVFLGAAVYPTVALFNHSCDPGIVRYFIGDTMIVRAIKPIRRGETIAENYGPIFTQMPKEKRQRTLRHRYWFDCQCEPCSQNWPQYSEMDNQTFKFRCSKPNCGFPIGVSVETLNPFINCPRCHTITNIMKGLQTLQTTEESFQKGMKVLDSGLFPEALQIFLRTLKDLDDVLSPPYRDYNLCQEAARKCMLSLGNRRIVSQQPK